MFESLTRRVPVLIRKQDTHYNQFPEMSEYQNQKALVLQYYENLEAANTESVEGQMSSEDRTYSLQARMKLIIPTG